MFLTEDGTVVLNEVNTLPGMITGSVGKTTTKDLLAGCLASTFRTAASERSFNNELGLPLTLLNAPDSAQWAVLEMGARHVGNIERLAEVARPDVGIVTRVANAHVEYFGGPRRRGPRQGRARGCLAGIGSRGLEFRRQTLWNM
jgi:UDP-N-acetylmuramyl pentapeptide synthase